MVPPSGYAVVGSGDLTNSNRTYIGFETGKTAGQPHDNPHGHVEPGGPGRRAAW